jgi:hypothetical protein
MSSHGWRELYRIVMREAGRLPQPIAAWEAAPAQRAARRVQVERAFAWQSIFGGGLSPLPAWVRTPARVTRRVAIKLILNHVRLLEKERVA